ncbi:MAG: hypothetical protein GYA57_13765 [Myxococcales bacterium]|nr:hypothetical protein [Myxococcales bacterium]
MREKTGRKVALRATGALPRALAGGFGLWLLLAGETGCGCGPDYTCGPAPALPISAFVVTIRTGDEGTDMDIHFCYKRRSEGDYSCTLLDSPANDFEAHQTDVFQIHLSTPIAVGDLDRFRIWNSGGGFFELSWEIDSIRIDGILADGTTVMLYKETGIGDELYANESYYPERCSY